MSSGPPPVIAPSFKPPSTSATLRKLFLTLFLRGRSSQGLTVRTVPTSIGRRLALSLIAYAAMGLFSLFLIHGEVFMLAAFLHGFTFLAIGMYLVSAAGETLFDRDEPEILLHRPLSPSAVLWAKVTVLVLVSSYLSFALNLVGLFVGLTTTDGTWLFPFVHVLSSIEEALFCAGCVVLLYQLCLRWFGRQRLENMMTTMQVLLMAAFTIGSQLLPRLVLNGFAQGGGAIVRPWWIALIPPGWFAGLDDAVAGSHDRTSWLLAAIGFFATTLVLWLAFVKLAKSYETGLQALGESIAPTERQSRRMRLLAWMAESPFRWWLKSPAEKVSFVLTGAYLVRDREVKLRVFPTLTTVLMMPFIMAISTHSVHGMAKGGYAVPSAPTTLDTFPALMGMALGAGFLASAPLSALNLLSFTQQWKAAEVFLVAPMRGPWPIQRGAMVAVSVMLVAPLVVLLIAFALFEHEAFALPLLLPGLLLVPVYGRLPALLLGSVPLSRPTEESKVAMRGCLTMVAPFLGMAAGMVAIGLKTLGWLPEMLLVEACAVAGFCLAVKRRLETTPWQVAG